MNDFLKKYGLMPYDKLLILTYKQLKLNEFELALLLIVHQLNQSGFHHITPKQIVDYMQLDFKQVDQLTMQLVNKGIVLVGLGGIVLTPLYARMEQLQQQSSTTETSIIDIFEKEFNRTLSVIEIEMIESWFHQGYDQEAILAALKEAILGQVLNFRYIDKILYQWAKKEKEEPSSKEKWWEN